MKTLWVLISYSLFTSVLFSQNKIDFDYNIKSEAFDKERKFYVHVHEDYYLNEVDSFGVVYVLDAQASSFYNNAKSIIDYLVWSYQISPMIVVGIHSDNRGTEFIPLDRSLTKDDDDNNGQVHLLQKHIEGEIFPIIKRDFRVNDFKALIGHSRAGAFIAATLFSEKRDLFNGYIAISPGMHYVNKQILNDAAKMIQEQSEFHKFYYCSYGTVGSIEKYFDPQVNYLDSLFSAHPNKTIDWNMKKIEGKTHWGVVAPSIADGMIKMNRAYQVDQYLVEQFAEQKDRPIKEQIDAHHQNQFEKLQYAFPVNPARYRRYGNEIEEYGNYKSAIELYDLAISLDGKDLRTYMNKGNALIEMGENIQAKKVYNEALMILQSGNLDMEQEQVDRYRKRIQNNLEKLK